MNFNKQQQRAIEASGHNILVSAGAGSGKTAVLSARVYKHICDDKWDVDSLLVLTFTNAAAANMKTKIRKRINEDAENKLTKTEKKKQLNKIDSSYIMTFDAYALFLIKKYHRILNLNKDINIIDNSILKIKTKELIEGIFLEEYQDKREDFLNLVNTFCIKDDETLKESVIDLNNKLSSIYNREEYLSDYLNKLSNQEYLNNLFNKYLEQLKEKINHIHKMIYKISNELEVDEYYPNFDLLYNYDTYEDIKENIKNFKPTRMPNGTSDETKELNKEIKDILKEIEENTIFTKEELIKQVINNKDNVTVLIRLANKLEDRLNMYKKDNNLFAFNDVFKMAIELVDKHEVIRKEQADQFKEILVDEYQDTNDLQEEFIKKIERNNVYMVGDIKQSIYRFRNANPKLFLEKYNKYQDNKDGELIELQENYRSRKEVLESVNAVFNKMMDEDIGGANYQNGHAMIAGKKDYDSVGKTDQNYNLEVLNYQLIKDDPFLKQFNKDEIEAFTVAQDIKKKVEEGYIIIDEDNNKLIKRKAKYSDFSILIDRGNNFDLYKKILTFFNIPCMIDKEEKMSDSELMIAIKAIFKLIKCLNLKEYNYDFIYSYASLARSFLIEMPDSKLFDIIRNKTFEDTEIFKTISEITKNIETKTISVLLDEIISKFNIYQKLEKIADIRNNLTKIEYLYELANNLNKAKYDYHDFDAFLTTVFEEMDEKDQIKYKVINDAKDAVNIMTIHKSKGLEFPIVYLPGLTVDFNRQELNQKMMFSKEYGLIIQSYIEDKGLKHTFIKDLYEADYLKEEVSERIRLFYVAMTRAKEKIIMVTSLTDNSDDSGKVISKYERLNINSFVNMLNLIYGDLSAYLKDVDLNDIGLDLEYNLNRKNLFLNKIEDTNEIFEISKLNKEYLPKEIKKAHYSKEAGLINKETIKKMEFGTKIHYYLEVLDFKMPDYSHIEDKYKDYINRFLSSEIIKDKDKAIIHKEYEFIYEEDNQEKNGVIDLLMEYEDHFDIVDYKLKNIDDEKYDEQLNGYRTYIKSLTNKPVNCYLYSILESTYRRV